MVAALGEAAGSCIEKTGAKWHVDLAGSNRLWLLRSGLTEEHIDMANVCTGCHPDLYWSHRKMGDARGVQGAVISL
jgi:copper oxidase (laccase) domain-containing protein